MKTAVFSFSLLFLSIFSLNLTGQSLIKAKHESDAQTSIDIEFSSIPSADPQVSSFSVTAGGLPMGIVAVTPMPAPAYRITLSSPLPIDPGQVIVTYSTTGSTVISQNNRPLVCSDFEWETNTRPTPSCAPVDPINKMVFSIKRGARNSSQFSFDKIESHVTWNDPANTISRMSGYESDESGTNATGTTFISFDAYQDNFKYPEEDGGCSYTSEWRIFIEGEGSCTPGNLNQFVSYTSHNVDDKGNGHLTLSPDVPNAHKVCLNEEAHVRFNDESTLNCITGTETPNNEGRWVRVIYGDPSKAAKDRIPNVYINGIQVTDDQGELIDPKGAGNLRLTNAGIVYTGSAADIFGVRYHPAPVTEAVASFFPITTVSTPQGLANRQPGDRFAVRMQYWNVCNPYDGIGNMAKNERSSGQDIVITDIPATPVAQPNDICLNSEQGSFSIEKPENSLNINWYDADPASGGRKITNPLGVNSAKLPAPGLIDKTTPGIYSVWVTQISDASSCESNAVETTLTVKDPLTQPGEISGPAALCNGASNVNFTVPDIEGSTVYGGEWEYYWTHSGGTGVSFDNNTGQSVSVDFNLGAFSGNSTTRIIEVIKRYKNSVETCTGERTTYKVTLYKPSLGGKISSAKTICETGSTGDLTLSAYRGKVITWQRQKDGGGYADIPGTANLVKFNEVLADAGNYNYRAVVANGECNAAFSTPVTVTVNPVPQKPVISEASGNPLTICENAGSVTLQSSNTDGAANTFVWYKADDLTTPVQSGESAQLVLTKASESGEYVVKVVGILPTTCESTLSDPVKVNINTLPSASLSGGGSVCAGNPAPDITWLLNGTPPFSFRIQVTGQPDIVETDYPSNNYIIEAPAPEITTNYEMVSLTDINNCGTGFLGGTATVTIGGTPPAFENSTPLAGPAVCSLGEATLMPSITFDMDLEGEYRLIFSINNGSTASHTFNTDTAGVFVLQPDYNEPPFNSNPGIYSYNLISISNLSTGCQTAIDQTVDLVVNAAPVPPANPQDVVVCSDSGTGGTLAVDDPGEGYSIEWFSSYESPESNTPLSPAYGAISGSGNNNFTPNSSDSNIYYAAVRNLITGCLSTTAVAVKQTQDQAPVAVADLDAEPLNNVTCTSVFALHANLPSTGETGTWSGPAGIQFQDIHNPETIVSNLPIGKINLLWTVKSALGGCSDASDELTIERFGLPQAIDPAPALCAEGDQQEVSGIDLITAYQDQITGIEGSKGLHVEWFTDAGRTTPVSDPSNYTASQANIIYTRVTDDKTSCFSEGTVAFTINPLPAALDLNDFLCEDQLNSNEASNVDLNAYNNRIIGSASPDDRLVEWFTDEKFIVAVPDPSNVVVKNGAVFYAKVTDKSNPLACSNTGSLEFTINPLPENNPISGPTTQCAGSEVQLYQINPILNQGSTYRWEVPEGFVQFGGGGKNDFFVLLNFPEQTTANLKVTEIFSNGCTGETQALTITVTGSPSPLKIYPEAPAVCENESGVVFHVENLPNTSYAWTVPSGAQIIKGQGTHEIVVNFGLSGGNVAVTPTSNSGNCAGSSAQTSVTVNPRPQLDPVPTTEVCSGEASGIILSYLSSGAPATGYDLLDISPEPGLTAGNSNATLGINQPADAIFNDLYENRTGRPLNVQYTVRPRSSKGCTGAVSSFILTVNPEPKLSALLNRERCSGEAANIILEVAAGSIAASSYNILSVKAGGLVPDTSNRVAEAELPYLAVQGDFLRNEIYRNYTSHAVDVTYTIAPLNGECTGAPSHVTLTIYPEPVGTDTQEQAKCSGESFEIDLQDIVNGNNTLESRFSWKAEYSTGISGGMHSGTGNISEALFNMTDTTVIATYTIEPTRVSSGCAGTPFKVVVPINPDVVAIDQNINVCLSDPFIDLNSREDVITTDKGNAVQWYTDAATTISVSTPKNFDVRDQKTVYALVKSGNCSNTAKISFSITDISVSISGVTSDYNGYDVSCAGMDDASVKFQAYGGTAPYTFVLNEDPSNTSGMEDGEFSGLSAGEYTVQVTDAAGCVSDISAPIVVKDPLPLNAGTVFGEANICIGSLPGTFNEISEPIGGTGNYTYQWELSTDGVSFANAWGATAQNAEYYPVEEDFSGGEGVYYFRRMVSSGDAPSCSNVSSNIIKVKINPLPSGDFSFQDTNGNPIEEICAGDPFLIAFSFSGGQADYVFDYHDDKGNTYTEVIGHAGVPVLVNFDQVKSTTTFTLDRVRDIYGCESNNPQSVSHTIKVLSTDPEFEVVGPATACSPSTVQFRHDQVKGVTYTWRWYDGGDSTYTATATEAGKVISHTFNNGSSSTTIHYEVLLYASDTSSTGMACSSYSREKITIYPEVHANISTQTPLVCSGEEIKFVNLSQGASEHRWYYRKQGEAGTEEQVQVTKDATFRLMNDGSTNPQLYEVVYTGSQTQPGGIICSSSQTVLVKVYQNVIPDFTFTPDPPEFKNGSAVVTFRNTSTPQGNEDEFSFNWDFDDGFRQNNTPNPSPVRYTTPGEKTIQLSVVKKELPGVCDASVTKTINIESLSVTANFEVDKQSLCLGSEVTITNKSKGDANEFVWEIYDENGVLVYKHVDAVTSIDATYSPSFPYTPQRAGIYEVKLSATNIYTGDFDEIKSKAFEVYETPAAIFETRPDVVMVPDQPLNTLNLSDAANNYNWDFGDGGTSNEFEPVHHYENDGVYHVTLIASATYPGITCSDTITHQVVAESGGDYRLPNAFTPSLTGPSGDGRIKSEVANDIFLPVTRGVAEFHMAIYNRWGNLIFESNDSEVGWDGYDKDGKLMPAGVYLYQLVLTFSNGQRRRVVGDVTLIR